MININTAYLNQLGISSENDTELNQFITDCKTELEKFLRDKWDEYKKSISQEEDEDNTPEAGQQQTEPVDENIENPESTEPTQPSEPSAENADTTENTEANQENTENTDNDEIILNIENPQKKGPDNYQEEKARNEVFGNQLQSKYITIPNGKVNQNYKYYFDLENIIPEIGEAWIEGLSGMGLNYDPETKEIKGIPNKSGEFQVRMLCKRKDWEPGKPIFERSITIIINPDPKSLWNNIATPDFIEYYKPDSDQLFVKVESDKENVAYKDMVAASQRGRSHAHEGKPRDDDFMLHFNADNEWYVMAVADGAGSAKYSRRGSQIACHTAKQICEEELNKNITTFEQLIAIYNNDKSQENRNEVGKVLYGIIGSAVFKSYKSIEREAVEKGYQLKDYSTTFILSICKKFSFGWFVGAYWVGDGGIGIYNKETQYLKVLGEPDGGEFAGQTRFLTMPEIIQGAEIYRRLRFEVVDDFTALILMTDGITDPKFETDANLQKIEKWDELWKDLSDEVDFTDDNEQAAGQLLKWLDFWSPGNHDDRTIAILF